MKILISEVDLWYDGCDLVTACCDVLVGFLSAADGCSATSMCCLYARSTAALCQVQCSATKTELSWHGQYVCSSDIATSIGIADVTAGMATDIYSTEVACDEPASNACQ